jgi:hypothetical protein
MEDDLLRAEDSSDTHSRARTVLTNLQSRLEALASLGQIL